MSTEKRANTIALKTGNEFIPDYENILEVDIAETQYFFKDMDTENMSFNFVPPFKDGVFIEKHPDRTGYTQWHTEIIEDTLECLLQGYVKIGNHPLRWEFTSTTSMKKNTIGSWCEINMSALNTPYAEALAREGKDNTEYLEKYANKIYATIVANMYRAFAWFNFLMSNPDYKKTSKTDDGCVMNYLKIKSAPEHIRKIRSRRICSLWSVSGHYRHYKNGKVIYIAPYLKGKHRDKYK